MIAKSCLARRLLVATATASSLAGRQVSLLPPGSQKPWVLHRNRRAGRWNMDCGEGHTARTTMKSCEKKEEKIELRKPSLVNPLSAFGLGSSFFLPPSPPPSSPSSSSLLIFHPQHWLPFVEICGQTSRAPCHLGMTLYN